MEALPGRHAAGRDSNSDGGRRGPRAGPAGRRRACYGSLPVGLVEPETQAQAAGGKIITESRALQRLQPCPWGPRLGTGTLA